MAGEHILIVEDEGLVAEDIKAHLEDFGYHVVGISASGENALKILQGTQIDLVIMDIVLAGEADGISTAEKIKTDYQIPVIYLTAYTDQERIDRARATEPYGYLVKPFDERELKTTVAMALTKALNDRSVRDGRRWAHAILNAIEDGVITIDQSARIHDMNPKSEQLLGQTFANGKNRLVTDILQFKDPQIQSKLNKTLHYMLQLKAAGEQQFSGPIILSENNEMPIELNLSRIYGEEDDIIGLVLAFRDISLQLQARKRLEDDNKLLERKVTARTEQLLHAKQKAESANIAKSQFLTNISHELITPLNPALGFAQILMLEDSLSETQKTYTNEIYQSCQLLLGKLKDLFALSRLETGSVKISKSVINPVEIIEATLQKFSAIAEQKSLRLEARFDADSIPSVIGDEDQISKVLQLLTDNALKFTDQGFVRISLSASTSDADSISLRFSVEDSGPGISPQLTQSIFDSFSQADGSSTRRHQGMGVGLSLSKQLIEYMGGSLGVNPLQPEGSCFWFELELRAA